MKASWTKEQDRLWRVGYRERNRLHLREYGRLWMRRHRILMRLAQSLAEERLIDSARGSVVVGERHGLVE